RKKSRDDPLLHVLPLAARGDVRPTPTFMMRTRHIERKSKPFRRPTPQRAPRPGESAIRQLLREARLPAHVPFARPPVSRARGPPYGRLRPGLGQGRRRVGLSCWARRLGERRPVRERRLRRRVEAAQAEHREEAERSGEGTHPPECVYGREHFQCPFWMTRGR